LRAAFAKGEFFNAHIRGQFAYVEQGDQSALATPRS
jgi:hypothetical protein